VNVRSEAVNNGVEPRWIHDPGLAVASRAIAAALGGYALATVAPVLLSQAIALPRVHAALAGLLLSPVVYTAAIMWAFAARSAGRAWIGLMIPTMLCSALNAAMRLLG
jgi:hypothetical protein